MEQDLESSILGQMEEQSITLAKQIEGLKIEAVSLQNYLEEPIEKCEEFLERNKEYTAITKKALEDEIERCKRKKSENIAKYMMKLRSQIEALWQQCYFGEEECQAFKPFQEQTFTEDLLILHEMEIERLCKYYKFCRPFVALVMKREDLAKEMSMIEQRTKVTNRYPNQGDRRLARNSRRRDTRKFRAETKRYEQEKSENIAKVVLKLRFQIQALWHQCYFGEEDRQAFKPYEVRTFTEDLLNLHEIETERLCKYYEDNRKIFELVKKRSDMWLQVLHLERSAKDPNHHPTRGSQPFTGEEEIRDLRKELLELEKQLKVLVEHYETKHGEPFKTDGTILADSLQRSGAEYIAVKRPRITLK